jgi:hypothetical protein
MSTTPANDPKPRRRVGALRLLWPYIKPHWRLAAGWLVSLGVASGATLVLPIAVRHMFDQQQLPGPVFGSAGDGFRHGSAVLFHQPAR